MENHPIEQLMKSTLENIKKIIDVNTIVGEAIHSNDGSTIVPISKISFGFASGGSEFSNKDCNREDKEFPFGGGSGAGVTIRPVAFLVIKSDNIRLFPVDQPNTYDRIVDSIPQIMDFFKNNTTGKNPID